MVAEERKNVAYWYRVQGLTTSATSNNLRVSSFEMLHSDAERWLTRLSTLYKLKG